MNLSAVVKSASFPRAIISSSVSSPPGTLLKIAPYLILVLVVSATLLARFPCSISLSFSTAETKVGFFRVVWLLGLIPSLTFY
jgi:hypothetical protein